MSPNIGLFLSLLAYCTLNAVCILLAATGAIHPPWGILDFFTFIGPTGASVAVLYVHFAQARFHPLVLLGFLGFMILAALVNLQLYGLALAAV